ncbi:MAG: monofunctional biosynthetic peptidoglycan transglycosylase [Silvanigrellales bacterium]|nr:monofunctional biosynthetic peptidoglycan transglycosylase [Silvanigrellales bacterium]
MKPLLFLLRVPVAVALAVGIATLTFFAWFFPWIFVFHGGFLIYFPYEPDGFERYARLTGPITAAWSSDWVPSAEISNHCKKALVASEDAKFFYHNGLDLESMEQSYRANERGGRIARGGSTITQQLVKNAFLSRKKSYVRKVREVAGSLLLDATLSKDSQLAWYFNIVEFGPRVYGIQAAARFYFRKDARELNKKECAQLVAILPAPNRWNASLVKKRTTSFFSRRTGTILARMDSVQLGVDEAVRKELSRERHRASLADRARSAAQKVREEGNSAPSEGPPENSDALPAPGEEEATSAGAAEFLDDTPLVPQGLLPESEDPQGAEDEEKALENSAPPAPEAPLVSEPEFRNGP